MTVVGKILVFVNLVFSLVVGGLVLVVFSTRTNWEDYSTKLKAQYDVVNAERQQTADEKDRLQAENAKVKQEYENALVALARGNDKELKDMRAAGTVAVLQQAVAARDQAQQELKTARDELTTIQQNNLKNNGDTAAAQAASGARKDQIKELENQIGAARTENQKLIKVANDANSKRIEAEVAARTLEGRNAQLEDQVRDLARELARGKTGAAPTVVTRRRGEENPPMDNVEGRIVRADPTSDLVTISVGSDAGLAQGHTLKVFRLDRRIPENSKYLGTIEILSVEPHLAVGRPLKRTGQELKPGDRVAARILPGGS